MLKEYPARLCRAIAATIADEAVVAGADGTCRTPSDDSAKSLVIPLDPYFEMGLDLGGGEIHD